MTAITSTSSMSSTSSTSSMSSTASRGGLFGSAPVMEVRSSGHSGAFIAHGGRILSPPQSLTN
jgi:uncharacterized protein (UPF0210 family)